MDPLRARDAGPPMPDAAGRPRARLTPQVFMGLIVIALGVLFTLDNLGVVDAGQYLQYWPAALVAIGILRLWNARGGHGIFGGLFFIVLGGWMLLEQTMVLRVNLGDIWPLLFVFLGGYLVWKGVGGSRPAVPSDGNAHMSALAIMSGVHRVSNSSAFQGADLTAVMGGCEVDLREAATAQPEAVIDVFAFWGGIEIRVPDGWTVIGRVTPIMAGYEDKTRQRQGTSTGRLVIRGVAIMGGIVVKN